MAAKKAKCYLCDNPGIDSHHIYPVEFGGADDGPKVNLCPTHHDEIHRLANKVWNRKVPLTYITPKNKMLLVKAIHDQHLSFVQTGEAPDARRRIVAQLSEEEQQMVRLIKHHHAFSSQEEMIKALIRKEALAIQSGKLPRGR